jgi:hypothetical protein
MVSPDFAGAQDGRTGPGRHIPHPKRLSERLFGFVQPSPTRRAGVDRNNYKPNPLIFVGIKLKSRFWIAQQSTRHECVRGEPRLAETKGIAGFFAKGCVRFD